MQGDESVERTTSTINVFVELKSQSRRTEESVSYAERPIHDWLPIKKY